MSDKRPTKKQLVDELAQLKERLSKQEESLKTEKHQRIIAETLLQSSILLNTSLNYEVVLDHIIEEIGNIIPCDAANIMIAGEDDIFAFRWRGYTQFSNQTSLIAQELNSANLFEKYPTLKNRKPLLISQSKDLDIYGATFTNIKSHLSIPFNQAEFIGLLNIDSAQPNLYSQADIDYLQAFSFVCWRLL